VVAKRVIVGGFHLQPVHKVLELLHIHLLSQISPSTVLLSFVGVVVCIVIYMTDYLSVLQGKHTKI